MKTDIRYFVYIRKSTDEEKRQIMSLDAQRRELREFAKRERLVIVDKIEESMTAKEPGRPRFNRMLERIHRGEANGVFCWDIDRLYRNPADEGQVRWMLQRNIIASIRTPTRAYSPADAGLLIAVEGGRATDFIIHHKRDVARGIREKLFRGEWAASQRPLGYLYDHDRRNIVPDPKRAKIVQTLFQEFSTGERGLVWASDRLAQLGVLTESGKQWSKWQVRYLLTNRLYTGVMVWNGEVFEGKYKPIISPELFKNVQKALKIRSKPRKTRVGHNFPFCGLFPCSCGSMMSAQWARGNGGLYRYYRCTRKTRKCSEPYVQETSVIEQCLGAVSPLGISANDATFVRALIDKQTEKDTLALETDTKKITEKISDVQAKLNKLTRAYLDALVDEDSYQAAKADLILEKTTLKGEKGAVSQKPLRLLERTSQGCHKHLGISGESADRKIPTGDIAIGSKSWNEPVDFSKTGEFHFV